MQPNRERSDLPRRTRQRSPSRSERVEQFECRPPAQRQNKGTRGSCRMELRTHTTVIATSADGTRQGQRRCLLQVVRERHPLSDTVAPVLTISAAVP
jgi:hypothetical protein